MRFVRVTDNIIGKTIAQPIVNNNGQILIAKNSNLTKKSIQLLENQGIQSVYIHSVVKSSLDDIIPQNDRKAEIREFKAFADGILGRVQNSNLMNLKKKIKLHNDLNKKIDVIATELMNKVNVNKKLSVVDIKSKKDYLYEHQVNVSILSIYLARKIGLNNDKIKRLAKAALIYDYGNFLIENNASLKEGDLTPEERKALENHTVVAYEFLKNQTDFSITEILPSLEHHERVDGNGYPHGKKGDEIHLFSKIISITDAYDSLTSDRPFRKAYPQSEAIELLMGSAGRAYDFDLTNAFVKNIIPYPNGTKVILSDHKTGFVIQQNKHLPLRPKVVVTSDRFTGLLDLKNETNITIKKVILE